MRTGETGPGGLPLRPEYFWAAAIAGCSRLQYYLRYFVGMGKQRNLYQNYCKRPPHRSLAGYSAQRFRREFNVAGGGNFQDDLIPWISGGPPEFRYANSGTTQWSLLGAYARLNYNYKRKYLLSAAIRRDGSSRFGTDNRWGNFPSLSLGWVITEEKFANNLGPLNYLKLRAGYGETGNFNIGEFRQYPNIGQDNYR